VLASERAERLAACVGAARRGARARLLARTSGPHASAAPRRNELVRTVVMHTGGRATPLAAVGAVVRRRVEPGLAARPVLSTALATLGRKRRAEVAALRLFGPLTGSSDGPIPTGEWLDVTPALLDRIGGSGWSWPVPDGGGMWTDGAAARLALDVGEVRDRDVVLGFLLGTDAHHSPNPGVQLLVNGRGLEGWQLGPDPEPGPRHARVPAWLVDWCRPLQVVMRPFGPFDPWARRGARDDQRRFVQLRALRVDIQ
jgi:hypothetical protein